MKRRTINLILSGIISVTAILGVVLFGVLKKKGEK